MSQAAEVLAFWFDEAGPEKWFTKDPAFDAEVRERFAALHAAADAGDLADWEITADGALAVVVLLDQFPRNMFRDDPRAFASDAKARAVADRAIAAGHDQALEKARRGFFYLPFEHSEDLADQERSLALFGAIADSEEGMKWARSHHRIIARFGRFPHRNAVLGRKSTPEELAFLEEPDSSF